MPCSRGACSGAVLTIYAFVAAARSARAYIYRAKGGGYHKHTARPSGFFLFGAFDCFYAIISINFHPNRRCCCRRRCRRPATGLSSGAVDALWLARALLLWHYWRYSLHPGRRRGLKATVLEFSSSMATTVGPRGVPPASGCRRRHATFAPHPSIAWTSVARATTSAAPHQWEGVIEHSRVVRPSAGRGPATWWRLSSSVASTTSRVSAATLSQIAGSWTRKRMDHQLRDLCRILLGGICMGGAG